MTADGPYRPVATGSLDTSVAHPSRVYDHWLGGKDHYPPDAEAARAVAEVHPGVVAQARANRALLARAVHHLVADVGLRQVLDVGCGLPSAPNVHQVAQAVDPQTRVLYLDNDPIVRVYGQALLSGTPGTVDVLDGDLRDPDRLLEDAARTLDLDRPVALLLLMVLQLVPDDDGSRDLVAALVDRLAPGSHVVLSHPLDTGDPAAAAGVAAYNRAVGVPMVLRSAEQVLRFVAGLDVVDPGPVPLDRWRPGPVPAGPLHAQGASGGTGAAAPALCVVARKP